MNMDVRAIWLLILLFPLVLFADPIAVTVYTTKEEVISKSLSSVGTLEPKHMVIVPAEMNGRITSISVWPGSEVKQGQILATIENPQSSENIAVANANLRKAQIAYDQQADITKKVQKLVVLKTYPPIRLQTEQAKLEMLRADLDAAKAANKTAETAAGYAQVIAPQDGVIQKKEVYLNSMVSIGTPMFVVTHGDALRAALPFNQQDRDRLKVGDPVSLNLPNASNLVVQGYIDGMDPILEVANRTFNVYVEFKNPGRWHSGMTVLGVVNIGVEKVIRVPQTAVFYNSHQAYIYVIGRDARIQKRPVEAELAEDDYYLITKGLQSGERVVTSDVYDLYENDQVIVK